MDDNMIAATGYRHGARRYAPDYTIRDSAAKPPRRMTAAERVVYQTGYDAGLASREAGVLYRRTWG